MNLSIFATIMTAIALCLAGCSDTRVTSAASSASSMASSSASSARSCTYTLGTPKGTLACPEQVYATTVIGTQIWLAQNLNYTPANGRTWCYNDTASYCVTYGRLYDYASAKTACPAGWHLPDTIEWNTLETSIGGKYTGGTKLKVTTGWDSPGNGTDEFGFSALPSGNYSVGGAETGPYFVGIGNEGCWWMNSVTVSMPNIRCTASNYAYVYHGGVNSSEGLAVRCLKD